MEDGKSHRSRALKINNVTSKVLVTHCSTRSGNNDESTILDTVQKAVTQQEKQVADYHYAYHAL